MRYKWRIVIENKEIIREQLVKVTHDSYIDSHIRIQNSYKRLKILFLLANYQENGQIMWYLLISQGKKSGLSKITTLAHSRDTWKDMTMDLIEDLLKS